MVHKKQNSCDGPKGDDCICLYDVVRDPTKRHNLAKEQRALLKELLARYNKYAEEPRDLQDQGYHSMETLPDDLNACKYMKENGGYWRP